MDDRLFGFHIARLPRDRYMFEDTFFAYRGKAIVPTFQAARAIATRINQRRDIATFPTQTLQASQINAIALIHGITHYLFRVYCASRPDLLTNAAARLSGQMGSAADTTLDRFLDEFPPQPIYHRQLERSAYLQGEHEDRRNREVTIEELLMLWLANQNPAFSPMSEFFSDDLLKQQTAYNRVTIELNTYFGAVARDEAGDGRFPAGMSIIDLLLEPVRRSPYSLEGQLRILSERWGGIVGAYVYRMLTAMDIIKEDFRAVPGHFEPGVKGSTPVPHFAPSEFEYEAFTPDREWMPNLVLIAKNAYVWLDQLSRQYGRTIVTLDQVPDEELDRLQKWGFTGLWLIGLWERSIASQQIKRITGNPDAVASAYSLLRYTIADRLGGEAACSQLRERAWKRGIRLASDMVPNHMGIDSDWVLEHPDWFLSLPYSPYPSYRFNGTNLSRDPRVGIYLEDHYYDRTDAAVVFKRVDHYTGDARYIYHGNDGTAMPWNDTAQLNYLNPEVREAMIRVILDIARQFPVIRFDAAMTLVKKHVQRLWFPEPGTGGAIPSRSEHGLTRSQFDQAMPEEFWREVIDRAAIEAPDTLLLAEAFWLLEGYFVRTLGMHRVYNSAFMNMLRDEENAKYRSVMKNTLEFDPEVLRRYVNFMNNPDEKTAVEQFGKGDKYFGICTLLVTMPGLPMIGHGQIEGFTEKYGMEYYRAYWDEQPDRGLIDRHEHEIFPLMKKRYLFAGVEQFLLYDFYAAAGVNENVFAYSNRVGDEQAVVLYNNAYQAAAGHIRLSAAYSVKVSEDTRQLVQRTLADGLGLHPTDDQWCIFRDHKAGVEYLRSSREIINRGLYAELGAYQVMVLVDWRMVPDSASGQYRHLAAMLGGRGVPSIDDALREIMVEPVRTPFREVVNGALFKRLLDLRTAADPSEADDLLEEVESRMMTLLHAVHAFTEAPVLAANAVDADAPDESAEPAELTDALADRAAELRETLLRVLSLPAQETPDFLAPLVEGIDSDAALWGGLLGWIVASALGDADDVRGWMDEWLLGRLIADAIRSLGANGNVNGSPNAANRAVWAVKLALGQSSLFHPVVEEHPRAILQALLQDTDAQQLLSINHFQGVIWYSKEGFDHLLQWMLVIGQLTGTHDEREARYQTLMQLMLAGEASGYRVETLLSALLTPLTAPASSVTAPSLTALSLDEPASPEAEPAAPDDSEGPQEDEDTLDSM